MQDTRRYSCKVKGASQIGGGNHALLHRKCWDRCPPIISSNVRAATGRHVFANDDGNSITLPMFDLLRRTSYNTDNIGRCRSTG